MRLTIYPEYLKYHKKHMWVREDGTIGITDFAQALLGEILDLRVPGPGTVVESGSAFGEIEVFKQISDLYSPVSGTIREVNTEVIDELGIINEDPYGKGWIAVIDMCDRSELDEMLNSVEYEKLVASRLFL